jgi:hypothetical protein
MSQKFAVSQHYFLFGSQWWRMFLLSSPFTRKAGNSKMPCLFFFSLTEVNISLERYRPVVFFIHAIVSRAVK